MQIFNVDITMIFLKQKPSYSWIDIRKRGGMDRVFQRLKVRLHQFLKLDGVGLPKQSVSSSPPQTWKMSRACVKYSGLWLLFGSEYMRYVVNLVFGNLELFFG